MRGILKVPGGFQNSPHFLEAKLNGKMTTMPSHPQTVLQKLFCCSRERAHLFAVTLPSSLAVCEKTEPVVQLLSERLNEGAGTAGVEPSWILELACGRVPFLTLQDLTRLASYLRISPSELCTLLYGPGHGPGSGALYAEFPIFTEEHQG